MIKSKRVGCLCFILFVSGGSFAACDMDSLSPLIAATTESASFIQTKHVPALSRPLVSTGLIYRGLTDELVWQIQQPLKSTLIISDGAMKQFDRNDVLSQTLSDPLVVEISTVFEALLSGNISSLDEYFLIDLTCDETDFDLQLIPEHESIKGIFTNINLYKINEDITIEYEESRGDQTQITFSAIQKSDTAFLASYLERSLED